MYNENEKPILHIDFDSPEGNIYAILQKAAKLLRKSFFTNQDIRIEKMESRVKKSFGYDEALEIIGDYVTIVPQGEI